VEEILALTPRKPLLPANYEAVSNLRFCRCPIVTTRNKYSNLSLLGHPSKFPESPEAATLETFSNDHAKRDYWITFECGEFTSMCPVTAQPDFAELQIRYVPDKLCIETKSLKYYLASFRNTRSFNEAIVNRILEDIVTACRPRRALVHGRFAPRGGISVIVDAEYPDDSSQAGRQSASNGTASRKRRKS
jgi:7-cyano-7-deazaguanine reductase